MRVLIVGGGAVGQVYGRHLERGGAEVTFFLKEKYADEARRGFTLYPLNARDRTEPRVFRNFGIRTSVAELRSEAFDQVWLCVAATALRGEWLPELLTATKNAAVVLLTQGIEDREVLLRHVSEDRLVGGMIVLISYVAPLPGETRFPEPGVAYWFPPLSASPFCGRYDECQRIVATLRRGGQPATHDPSLPKSAPYSAVMMEPYIAALEAAGWRFDEVRRGDHLALASRAVAEACAVVARHTGTSPPAARLLARPFPVRCALSLAPWVIPIDMATYLQAHFTKVGDQTRMYLDSLVRLGEGQGQPVDALAALRRRLDPMASGVPNG